MAKLDKMPVNARSIIRRIGRKLPEHQMLRKQQGGAFFIIDTEEGSVIETGDLEVLARKIGALEKWERMIDD